MPVVEIVDVGPRDGLQNEPAELPTAAKVDLIRRSVAAGVRRIEVTSFVNPKRVPRMADAEAVVDTATWLGEQLGRPVPALLGRAGAFPPAGPSPDPS